MNLKMYILDLLKNQKDIIAYNIGIVATIITNGDNPALDPIPTKLVLPDNIILNIEYKAINNRMSLLVTPEPGTEYVFQDNKPVTIRLNNPDMDIILSNLATIIVNRFNIGTSNQLQIAIK